MRCLSVTFVYSVNTSNHIFKFFSSLDRHTILAFPYQMLRKYSDGDRLTGAKIEIFYQYLALASMNAGPLTVELGYSA